LVSVAGIDVAQLAPQTQVRDWNALALPIASGCPVRQNGLIDFNRSKRNSERDMTSEAKTHYEVIVVGAGVAGIYQIQAAAESRIDATVLEGAPRSRRAPGTEPLSGCRRFRELHVRLLVLARTARRVHWKERFSGQPENLALPELRHRQVRSAQAHAFNCKVDARQFDETRDLWQLRIGDGRT